MPTSTVVSGLTVSPATITPASDGSGLATTVSFTLSAAAQVTVTVTASTGGLPLLTLLSARLPAGPSTHQWDIGILPNGRFKLVVSATPVGEVTPVVVSADVTVDRTLGAFLATPAVVLAERRRVERHDDAVVPAHAVGVGGDRDPARGREPRHGLLGAAPAGIQAISWDGASAGARLPDGDYVAVVTATSSLGTVSLLQPVSIDTTAPVLTLVDGPGLRFDLNEAATVTAVVNGQTVSVSQPRGAFTIPWTSGAVTLVHRAAARRGRERRRRRQLAVSQSS